MLRRSLFPLLLAGLALAGCNDNGSLFGPGGLGRPTDLRARYDWVLEGWQGTRPVGHPTVTVNWKVPSGWDQEPFRVYARRTNQGSFSLIATVTSCDQGACRYTDINVVPGNSYEYYVATVDEGTDTEASSDYRVPVSIPAYSPPPAPQADTVFGLDNALYLRWKDAGSGKSLWKYQVYLVAIDNTPNTIYQLGETDGTGFLDQRAKNGSAYSYRVAAVDTLGQVSDLGPIQVGIPRPDYRGELVYAQGDSTAASGFRFVAADSLNPVLSGDSPNAQWRLEVVNGAWQIRPLGETQVVSAGRTTALTCGPARDPGCTAVYQAPTAGYSASPVTVNPEFSYVFRVRASDGQLHYGVIRAQILGSSQGSRRLMIFDWAYQLRANEPRLSKTPQ